MEWLPECRKTVNIFVNTSILDEHAFNPADIDNIIERVRPANELEIVQVAVGYLRTVVYRTAEL